MEHAQFAADRPAMADLPFTGPDHVIAEVTHAVKTDIKPHIYTAALTGGAPKYFAPMANLEVKVENARRFAGDLSLEREGVALRRHETRVVDFYDDDEVEAIYYREMEALLKKETGASRVIIFDHTRRRDDGMAGVREPAAHAHNDFTERSGPQRLVDLIGREEVEALGDRRFAQVNVWRPMRGPVLRKPLALVDASTLEPDDLILTDMIYPDRVGEIYHVAYNPRHRWFYFPEMEREEVVLIKGYDSEHDGRSRFTPHSAFDDPATEADAPARESIEVRAFLIF